MRFGRSITRGDWRRLVTAPSRPGPPRSCDETPLEALLALDRLGLRIPDDTRATGQTTCLVRPSTNPADPLRVSWHAGDSCSRPP
jgi:hypothetical protein